MEMSTIMKVRVGATMALGALVLGLFLWPIVRPVFPSDTVTLYGGAVNIFDALMLLVACYVVGLAGYFIAYPYGARIGHLAVPAGLGVWSLLSGSMRSLLVLNPSIDDRLAIYSVFKFEVFFWLMLVMVGSLGVLTAIKIKEPKQLKDVPGHEPAPFAGRYINDAVAIFVSIIIANVVISLFAQDVRVFDPQLGTVTGQPAAVQVGFAVIAGFLAAAFLVKLFLKTGYFVPILCTGILYFIAISASADREVLAHMADSWPPAFFPRAIMSVLPIQIVCFGAIGSVAGYWLAIQYSYWRKNAS